VADSGKSGIDIKCQMRVPRSAIQATMSLPIGSVIMTDVGIFLQNLQKNPAPFTQLP
jgi:hypothetical protein